MIQSGKLVNDTAEQSVVKESLMKEGFQIKAVMGSVEEGTGQGETNLESSEEEEEEP